MKYCINEYYGKVTFEGVQSPWLDQGLLDLERNLGPSALKNASAAASMAGYEMLYNISWLPWIGCRWSGLVLGIPSWDINNMSLSTPCCTELPPCPQLYHLIWKVYQVPTMQLDLSPLMHMFRTNDRTVPNCWSMEQPAKQYNPSVSKHQSCTL